MGFAHLILIDAPPVSDEARALAYGAWDVLDAAQTAPSLSAAVSDCTVVAATSGRAEEDTLTPRQFAEALDRTAAGGPAAVVFGPEDNGLTTAERRLCHVTVRIPSAPEQPSLNLAQAVLVLAYELRMAGDPKQAEPRERVGAAEFESAIGTLRAALVEIGYLNRANPHAIMAELRDLIWRGAPSTREIALLRGLARQIDWAARQARQTGGGGRV
jgi:TrmH family RNA methyltransferase